MKLYQLFLIVIIFSSCGKKVQGTFDKDAHNSVLKYPKENKIVSESLRGKTVKSWCHRYNYLNSVL